MKNNLVKTFIFLVLSSYLFASTVMTLDEKIGQLFMVPADPDKEEALLELFEMYPINSVIDKSTDLKSYFSLFQKLKSQKDLFIGVDAEWGLGMRMKDAPSYPMNLTLGAIQDEDLIYDLGVQIAKDCRKIGAHINFSPVVDVNTNPLNPIIHMRSFGENIDAVGRKATAFMKGMQSQSLLTCCKHFPGHGDTKADSHFTLPVVFHSLEKLQIGELIPFQKVFDSGVDAVMSAHLFLPNIEPFLPSTLSKKIIHDFVRKDLNYEGLIISDALNMKALDHFTPEEIALLAFRSGHDLLLYGDHIKPNIEDILKNQVPRAFQALKKAFLNGDLDMDELDQKVEKIQRCKQKCNLKDPLYETTIEENIDLKKKLYQKALTSMDSRYLPLEADQTICFITLGADNKYKGSLEADTYVVFLKDILYKQKGYGIKDENLDLIHKWDQNKKVILVLFGTPYSLRYFQNFQGSLIVAYEQDPLLDEIVWDFLYGKIKAEGKLPV